MRKWLVALAIVIAGTWIAMWMGAALIGRLYSDDASRAWPLGLGTLTDAQERYPQAPESPGAVRLIDASTKLGIFIAPRDQQPGLNWNSNQQLLSAVQTYVASEIAKPSAAIDPIQPALADYLAAHAADLAAVRLILLGDNVQWDVEYPSRRARVPNLLGHTALARLLLANALDRARRNDRGAWDDARAVVALTGNLWSRPELISSLIALTLSRAVNAVARKLPLPAPEWFTGFQRFDYTRAVLAARQAETSLIAEALAAETSVDDPRARRFVDAVLSPYRRMTQADALEVERRIAIGLLANRACAIDVPAVMEQRRAAAAWWNLPARRITTPMDAAWPRLLRFRAELESTERALRLRAGQPPLPQSSCTGLHWLYDERGFRPSNPLPGGGPNAMPLEFSY